MEQLAEIIILEGWGITINALMIVQIVFVLLGLLLVNFLVYRKLLPWYYGRESTTAKNLTRIKRVVSLLLISVFAISALRILGIDYQFFSLLLKKAPHGDEAPVIFSVKISTIVTTLVAFVLANVFDLIISEFLVQRLHAAREKGDRPLSDDEQNRLTRQFGAVRPIMYILATIVATEVSGLARYWFFRDPHDVRLEPATLIVDVELILFLIPLCHHAHQQPPHHQPKAQNSSHHVLTPKRSPIPQKFRQKKTTSSAKPPAPPRKSYPGKLPNPNLRNHALPN